jgi:hypothetical protein
MKFVLILFVLLFSNLMVAQNLPELRNLLKNAENSEKSAKSLIQKSEDAYSKTKRPIYSAFLATGQFLMAKHVFSPFKKMSYFNEGKKNLEKAVKDDPKNVEIRLMRLITQEQAPKLLGYTKNIEEDRKLIVNNYKGLEDVDLKLYIKKYLNL